MTETMLTGTKCINSNNNIGRACPTADPGVGRGGGGQGVRYPLKNHKPFEFLMKTDPDPLKNHKTTKVAFNVGPSSAR